MAVLVKTLDGAAYGTAVTPRNGLSLANAKTINGLDVTAGGGFEPSDIAGLFIDLDPDYLIGTLSNGDPVSTYYDISGNGYNFTQSSGGSRPEFQYPVPAINNHALLYFDGVTDWMFSGTIPLVTDYTLFWVGKKIGSDLFIATKVNENKQVLRVNTVFQYYTGTDYASGTLAAPSDWMVMTMRYSGGTLAWWENGVSRGSVSAGAIASFGWLNAVYTGSPDLMCEANYVRLFGYDTALSTGDQELAESGIGAKYGITITH